MTELNYKNLTVKYDDTKISKASIRKNKAIEIIWVLCIFIGIIIAGLVGALLNIEVGFWLFLFDLISILAVLGGGMFVLYKIQERILPRYFDLVTWLMKFKHNEIEAGWLNNRFIIELWDGRGGWMKYNLQKFIGCDYILVDSSDKIKPIFMTIDLTTDMPRVEINTCDRI